MATGAVAQILLKLTGDKEVRAGLSGVGSSFAGLNLSVVAMATAMAAAASYGAKQLVDSFIDAASSAEQARVKLDRLLGSTEEGGKVYSALAKYARESSAEFEELMNSAASLSGVMTGEDIVKWMPIIDDLRAAYGLSIEETTGNVIRMLTSGAASADLFREKGILSMMGFQAGVSYSAEETARIMEASWSSSTSKFRGMSSDQAVTWKGSMSMMSDDWFAFQNAVADAGAFEDLKGLITQLREQFARWTDGGNAENVAYAFGLMVDSLRSAVLYAEMLIIYLGMAASTAKEGIANVGRTAAAAVPSLQSFAEKFLGGPTPVGQSIFRKLLGSGDTKETVAAWEDIKTSSAEWAEKMKADYAAVEKIMMEIIALSEGGTPKVASATVSTSGIAAPAVEKVDGKAAAKEWDEYVKARVALEEELARLTLGRYDFEREQARAWAHEQLMVVGDGAADRVLVEQALTLKLGEIDKAEAEARVQAHAEALERIKGYSEEYHLFRERELETLASEMRKAGLAEVDIARWKAEEMKALVLEETEFRLENADTIGEALTAKMELMKADVVTVTRAIADSVESIFSALRDTLSDVFFDAIMGEFESIEDYLRSFTSSIARTVTDALAQQVVGSISSSIGSASTGGGVSASGGGDGLSSLGMGSGNTTVINISAIDTQSFADALSKNSAVITSAVSSDIKRGGSVRTAIRGAF